MRHDKFFLWFSLPEKKIIWFFSFTDFYWFRLLLIKFLGALLTLLLVLPVVVTAFARSQSRSLVKRPFLWTPFDAMNDKSFFFMNELSKTISRFII